MKNKKNSMGFYSTNLNDYPPEFAKDFICAMQNNHKPSYSLRQLMANYELSDMHPFLVVNLFKQVYPDMLLLHLGAWLYEHRYPGVTAQVSDSEFDKMIERLLRKSYAY
ncbi:MAG: hypothetical protein KTR20_03460 [Cellvibrionaceae bacterium]|nr:hypothetical protein [Cellvibrionaceae bacterium]